ncbi:MAG: hypothetical protein L6R38_001820 [Xanthoria sp. 2 TBL-2021]|nr:MAG: hypothetical protein L6R38_001820 [Xanthoria sp. 2 TBL-2021]
MKEKQPGPIKLKKSIAKSERAKVNVQTHLDLLALAGYDPSWPQYPAATAIFSLSMTVISNVGRVSMKLEDFLAIQASINRRHVPPPTSLAEKPITHQSYQQSTPVKQPYLPSAPNDTMTPPIRPNTDAYYMGGQLGMPNGLPPTPISIRSQPHQHHGRSSLKILAERNKTLSNEPGNDAQGDKEDEGKEDAAAPTTNGTAKETPRSEHTAHVCLVSSLLSLSELDRTPNLDLYA